MESEFIFYIDFSNVDDHCYQYVRLPTIIKRRSSVTFLYIIYFIQMTPEAEKFNGWAAMLGFVAAFGAYATTGQIIPGIF